MVVISFTVDNILSFDMGECSRVVCVCVCGLCVMCGWCVCRLYVIELVIEFIVDNI